MAKRIEVPGMGVVEFPDDMSDDQIVAVLRQQTPRQSPTPPNPSEGIGPLQAGLIAAGRTTDKIVQGVRQVYNKATGDDATLAKMADEEAEKDRLFKPLQQARPISTAIGGAAPMLAIPAGGATAGAFMARSAAAGAAPGLLSYGSAEDRLKAGAIGGAGGAVGGAIGLGAARALKPAGAGAAGVSDDALAAAKRLGVKLSPGQRSQNPAMLNFENYLARSPGSSGAMQARSAANQSAVNRAAAKSIGQGGDELTENLFATAKDGIGREFQRLQDITAPTVGDDFLGALAKIDADNIARGSFRSKSVDTLVDKGIDLAAKGKLTGKAYKEIRTVLTNDANAAFKSGDATLGQALKTVRASLDEAAKASLSKADQKAWETTRAQWAAYKSLTKSNIAEAGSVSPARLAAEVRRGGDGLRTGAKKGELADIARLGEAFKTVQNPNSGQLTQQMLYGNPLTGVPMMAGNKAAQMLYTSPLLQGYLSGGLLDVGQAGRRVLGNLGGPTGAPLVQNYLGAE